MLFYGKQRYLPLVPSFFSNRMGQTDIFDVRDNRCLAAPRLSVLIARLCCEHVYWHTFAPIGGLVDLEGYDFMFGHFTEVLLQSLKTGSLPTTFHSV